MPSWLIARHSVWVRWLYFLLQRSSLSAHSISTFRKFWSKMFFKFFCNTWNHKHLFLSYKNQSLSMEWFIYDRKRRSLHVLRQCKTVRKNGSTLEEGKVFKTYYSKEILQPNMFKEKNKNTKIICIMCIITTNKTSWNCSNIFIIF